MVVPSAETARVPVGPKCFTATRCGGCWPVTLTSLMLSPEKWPVSSVWPSGTRRISWLLTKRPTTRGNGDQIAIGGERLRNVFRCPGAQDLSRRDVNNFNLDRDCAKCVFSGLVLGTKGTGENVTLARAYDGYGNQRRGTLGNCNRP